MLTDEEEVSVSRWDKIIRRTGRIDRESLQWLFATCGVIASVLGFAQFLWPNGLEFLNAWWLLGMLTLGVVVGVALRLVRRKITALSPSGTWAIEIGEGSILSHRPAVITTDRKRTVDASQIAENSLMRQYIQMLSVDDRLKLAHAVGQPGARGLLPPGDVVDSPVGDGVLLLACGRPTTQGTITTWSHLSKAYEGLWVAIRSRHLSEVSIPVIGAGFSRVSLSHSAVLLGLLLSYHAASNERLVCTKLRILISPEDFSQEELVLIRRFLAALQYSFR